LVMRGLLAVGDNARRGVRVPVCASPFINIKFAGFAGIVIPVPQTSLILIVSCPMRGCFLEAVLRRTERELAGPGRPGTVDRLVAEVERREALRPTSLGARGWLYQLREVGPLIPPPRVPAGALAPPAAPPSPAWVRWWRSAGKTRTQCAARMRKLGCLKFWISDRETR
jgi:hypothetical protein